jgi:hypothetical protein
MGAAPHLAGQSSPPSVTSVAAAGARRVRYPLETSRLGARLLGALAKRMAESGVDFAYGQPPRKDPQMVGDREEALTVPTLETA